MKRFKNYMQAKDRLKDVFGSFKNVQRRIQEERDKSGTGGGGIDDVGIEAHACTYLIPEVLRAFNWTVDTFSDDQRELQVLRESPLRSKGTKGRDSVKWLDFLGLDHQEHRPLLVIEAKHPSAELPVTSAGGKSGPFDRAAVAAKVISGLQGSKTDGDWTGWLKKAREDYFPLIKSQHHAVPKRWLFTNGRWWVLLMDPQTSFEQPNELEVKDVIALETFKDLLDNIDLVFDSIEYYRLSDGLQSIGVDQASALLKHGEVTYALRGLRLQHSTQHSLVAPSVPDIRVSPSVFLRMKAGPWLRVDSADEFAVPRVSSKQTQPQVLAELTDHHKAVSEASAGLISSLAKTMGDVTEQDIEFHYGSHESFEMPRGVTEIKEGSVDGRFQLVLGKAPHYFNILPTEPSCAYHTASGSGSSAERVVTTPSVKEPKSYFVSGQPFHCAHPLVAQMHTQGLPESPGIARSYNKGGPFCELGGFEERQCCRTCVYEKVCSTSSTLFKLPCGSGP